MSSHPFKIFQPFSISIMNKVKYAVLANFQDSQNGLSFHAAGETVELTEERGIELAKAGFVGKYVKEEIEEVKDDATGETVVLTEKVKGKIKNEAK